MPLIITVANAKGGVGKSTITYCLACYYSERGASCAVLDEDIQQSISDAIEQFQERGDDVSVSLIDRTKLKSYKDLADPQKYPYDIIFIDSPPVLTTQLEAIYDLSDMILIPIKPSINDYNSLMRSKDYIKEAMNRNPDLLTAIVINMAVSSSTIQDNFREAFQDEDRIKVLKTQLAQRVIYTKYPLLTHSLFKTKDTAAKREMAELANEIYYTLEFSRKNKKS